MSKHLFNSRRGLIAVEVILVIHNLLFESKCSGSSPTQLEGMERISSATSVRSHFLSRERLHSHVGRPPLKFEQASKNRELTHS